MTMWQELEKLNNTPREDLQPIRIHLVGGATDPPAVNAAVPSFVDFINAVGRTHKAYKTYPVRNLDKCAFFEAFVFSGIVWINLEHISVTYLRKETTFALTYDNASYIFKTQCLKCDNGCEYRRCYRFSPAKADDGSASITTAVQSPNKYKCSNFKEKLPWWEKLWKFLFFRRG